MNGRINWIDWAKAIAVSSVVFCHLPQSQEWFYYRYLQAVTITVFFFISGYLKHGLTRKGASDQHGLTQASDQHGLTRTGIAWRKYWQTLIAPYLLYNAIVYPYWLFRYYLQNGSMPDVSAAMKPIVGALLFEYQSSFAEPLNGPLWYLPAILFMHLLTDLCRKTRHQHLIMIGLCVISYFLYAANKQWEFMHNLTPMGIFRRLPYYYIGYVMAASDQHGLTQASDQHGLTRKIAGVLTGFGVSIILFYWHLHEDNIWWHTLLFYPINIGALWGVLSLCKLLDSYKLKAVINLSVGTLVIVGIHTVLIGVANFGAEHYLGRSSAVGYHWYEALAITAIIIALLYPVILFGKKHARILLGK